MRRPSARAPRQLKRRPLREAFDEQAERNRAERMARKAAVLAHVEAFGEAYAVEIAERIDWPANARRGRAQRIALIRSTLQQLEDEGKLVGETRYEGPGVRRYYRIRIEP